MPEAPVVISAETSDAEINVLAGKWAYQAGLPAWLLNRLLHAERRIAQLEKSKG